MKTKERKASFDANERLSAIKASIRGGHLDRYCSSVEELNFRNIVGIAQTNKQIPPIMEKDQIKGFLIRFRSTFSFNICSNPQKPMKGKVILGITNAIEGVRNLLYIGK